MKGSSFAVATLGFLACALALCLLGCASEGEKSAREITVTPALSEDFLVVDEGMKEHQDDAKLVGISTRRTLAQGGQSEWCYQYVSREQVREYSCMLERGAFSYSTRMQAGGSYLYSEMEAIPSPDVIVVDADAAYDLVSNQLGDDQVVESVDVYLRTFVSVVEGGADSGIEALAWYFVFNRPAEDSNEASASAVGDVDVAGASSESFIYLVDAVTGEVAFAEAEVEAKAD